MNSLKDPQLVIDIAIVCENMKQWLEAATLFQKGGLPEKAAAIYIQIKHLKQAIPLIEKINSPKLLRELGKAQEADKHYREAEKAYERANDWESVIRISLKCLDDEEKAQEVLRKYPHSPVCCHASRALREARGQEGGNRVPADGREEGRGFHNGPVAQ